MSRYRNRKSRPIPQDRFLAEGGAVTAWGRGVPGAGGMARAFALLLLSLALGGCAAFTDRSGFSVVGTGTATSIRSPGHHEGEPLVVEPEIPASWWNNSDPACSRLTVQDFEPSGDPLIIHVHAWPFLNHLSLVLNHPGIRDASLPLIGDRGLPARLTLRAHDPIWPDQYKGEEKTFGVLPMALYTFLRQCVAAPDTDKRTAIEKTLAAILGALPRSYRDELRFQFGVYQGLTKETKKDTEPPLGIVRVTANTSLLMTTPTQPSDSDSDSQPFSGITQSQITAAQRATVFCDGSKCESETFEGLDFSPALGLAGTKKIGRNPPRSPYVDYVDGAWWQMHQANTSRKETLLPLGAYLLYPVAPPLEDPGGKDYWPKLSNEFSMQSPVWLVLDYGETMASSDFYDTLKALKINDKKEATCKNLQSNKRITCKAFIGPTLVEARIKVYLNGTAQWVPAGSVVADVVAHDQPEPHAACPTLNADEKSASMLWPGMRLPTLRRTFGARTSVAVAEPDSAILCLPLIPGDRLTW